ncbi:MAG TPA: hypothetical protein VFK48_05375 [Usitatibacter sp.]|nr:hypothetical protein [Usitatibacter sp.]
MEKMNLARQLPEASDQQDVELESPFTKGNEVRALNDLEMILVGGGECVVCW